MNGSAGFRSYFDGWSGHAKDYGTNLIEGQETE